MDEILRVENLSLSFEMYDKGLNKKNLEVIHELSLNVNSGEILAIVGSSGSGKSLLAHSIMGILPTNSKMSGSIKYKGKELDKKYLKELRGKEIAFIPQSVEFLDPLMKIKKQVMGIKGHKGRRGI